MPQGPIHFLAILVILTDGIALLGSGGTLQLRRTFCRRRSARQHWLLQRQTLGNRLACTGAHFASPQCRGPCLLPPCSRSCYWCTFQIDDPVGVSPGGLTASTPGPSDHAWVGACVVSRTVVRPRSLQSPCQARTALPQHRPPLHSQSWGRPSTRPAAVVRRDTRPPVCTLVASHGMDLQTDWDTEQTASTTTALADHLFGILLFSTRLGEWPDRFVAGPRLSWEPPPTALSWNQRGQLLSRARGCVTRSRTGDQRARCGRTALLLLSPPPHSPSSSGPPLWPGCPSCWHQSPFPLSPLLLLPAPSLGPFPWA